MADLMAVLRRTWYLGLTSFGGPVVHFSIFRRMFVEGRSWRGVVLGEEQDGKWLDEQTFQELFGLCQALPGPGSTKVEFCLALMRGGFLAAMVSFLFWSLPGAIGMYLLAFGVSRLQSSLPLPVYALLSGLNAATVGLVLASAVQLARTVDSRLPTRTILIFSACAGICYSALWLFPLLVVCGGLVSLGLYCWEERAKLSFKKRRAATSPSAEEVAKESAEGPAVELPTRPPTTHSATSTTNLNTEIETASIRSRRPIPSADPSEPTTPLTPVRRLDTTASWLSPKAGLTLILSFFAIFIAIMVTTSSIRNPPLELQLFRSMLLAGTIIFGGGPVVIPLLRQFVVEPGWVSSRDFLFGLAIIQAFPGPNFNFAVYLGALTLLPLFSTASPLGGFLAFLGIFLPGLMLATGFHPLWRAVRSNPFVGATLKGINAAAVGLVFTAVYRLWEQGYLEPNVELGGSLGKEPWWVVVAAASYSSLLWYKCESWMAIIGGAVAGLVWFGVVKPWGA